MTPRAWIAHARASASLIAPDDGVDGLLEGVPVGRDDAGIGRDPERGYGSRRIELVPPAQGLQDRSRLVARGIQASLCRPSLGALLDRRVEVDLEVRIGQHDRADVAPGHDDPAGRRQLALALEQGEPQFRDRGDRRDRAVHGRTSHIGRVVLPVDDDARQSAGLICREFDFVSQAAEGVRVRGGQPARQGEPGHGPIQQAGVAEPVAAGEGRGRPDAALAR